MQVKLLAKPGSVEIIAMHFTVKSLPVHLLSCNFVNIYACCTILILLVYSSSVLPIQNIYIFWEYLFPMWTSLLGTKTYGISQHIYSADLFSLTFLRDRVSALHGEAFTNKSRKPSRCTNTTVYRLVGNIDACCADEWRNALRLTRGQCSNA